MKTRIAVFLSSRSDIPAAYLPAAREVGERLRMEQGCVNAANIVEHELRKWLREEGREPIIVPQNDQVG